MSTNRSRGRAQTLPIVLALVALVVTAGAIACGNSPTGPSSVMPVPLSTVDEVRDFSGLVDIPLPTTIDLSLGIQRQSVDATPLLRPTNTSRHCPPMSARVEFVASAPRLVKAASVMIRYGGYVETNRHDRIDKRCRGS